MNPILIGQAEEIDLVQQQVRDMLAAPGFYIGGDTQNPQMNVPLVSMDGRVFSMEVDNELDPERFLETLTLKGPFRVDVETFDLIAHLHRQREFSEHTFGPGARTAGVIDHIRKELNEIEAKPDDVSEWVDVILLALDGAWRAGFSPEQIAQAIAAKQERNESRKWPDWRTAEPGKAIEHVREELA